MDWFKGNLQEPPDFIRKSMVPGFDFPFNQEVEVVVIIVVIIVVVAVAVIVIAAAARLVGGAARHWRWLRAGQAGFVPRGGFRNQPAVRAEVQGAALRVVVLAPTGRELAGWAGGAPRPRQALVDYAQARTCCPKEHNVGSVQFLRSCCSKWLSVFFCGIWEGIVQRRLPWPPIHSYPFSRLGLCPKPNRNRRWKCVYIYIQYQ